MTDSSRSFSQDDPYPDEDLLEGLQKLVPTASSPTEVARGGETEGSLLLDSINTYIHNSQPAIESIQETTEEEQDAPPALQIPLFPTTALLDEETTVQIIGVASSQSDRNSSPARSKESPAPLEHACNAADPE
jgi:hypothetical protein